MSEIAEHSIEDAAVRQAKALEEIARTLKDVAASHGQLIVETANLRRAMGTKH